MPISFAFVQKASFVAFLQKVAPATAVQSHIMDLAPMSRSTFDSSGTTLPTNPSASLEDVAPLTWQTLQQLQSTPFSHLALVAAPLEESHSTRDRLEPPEQVRGPSAALAVQDSMEDPRHARRARDALDEPVRLHAERQSFASKHGSSDGSLAALDEAGYQAVANLRDSRAMWFFIRRVVEASDAEVLDEGMFNGLVPYYSGERDVQSFERLNEELFQSGVEKGMIRKTGRHARSFSGSMYSDMAEVYERTHRL